MYWCARMYQALPPFGLVLKTWIHVCPLSKNCVSGPRSAPGAPVMAAVIRSHVSSGCAAGPWIECVFQYPWVRVHPGGTRKFPKLFADGLTPELAVNWKPFGAKLPPECGVSVVQSNNVSPTGTLETGYDCVQFAWMTSHTA